MDINLVSIANLLQQISPSGIVMMDQKYVSVVEMTVICETPVRMGAIPSIF